MYGPAERQSLPSDTAIIFCHSESSAAWALGTLLALRTGMPFATKAGPFGPASPLTLRINFVKINPHPGSTTFLFTADVAPAILDDHGARVTPRLMEVWLAQDN